MRRDLRVWLVAAVALASLVALSGSLPSGAAVAAAPAGPPWEAAGPFPSSYDLRASGRVTARSLAYTVGWNALAIGSNTRISISTGPTPRQ